MGATSSTIPRNHSFHHFIKIERTIIAMPWRIRNESRPVLKQTIVFSIALQVQRAELRNAPYAQFVKHRIETSTPRARLLLFP
jgi:hypothetical protein